jgi:uncharacterized membrane protein YgdD (TMEM256/DUF423 family)
MDTQESPQGPSPRSVSRLAFTVGAVLCALAVALGAFGTHGLQGRVTEPRLLQVWDTAVRYHQMHGLGLLLLGAAPAARRGMVWLFVLGIALFSGSLYAMTLTGVRALGAITPLGGLCFLGGWTWLAIASWRRR